MGPLLLVHFSCNSLQNCVWKWTCNEWFSYRIIGWINTCVLGCVKRHLPVESRCSFHIVQACEHAHTSSQLVSCKAAICVKWLLGNSSQRQDAIGRASLSSQLKHSSLLWLSAFALALKTLIATLDLVTVVFCSATAWHLKTKGSFCVTL